MAHAQVGFAARIGADADAVHVVAVQHQLHAGGRRQRAEQRIDRAVALRGLGHAVAIGVGQFDQRVGAAADVTDGHRRQAIALRVGAALHQRLQVGIGNHALLFAQALELLEHQLQFVFVQPEAQRTQARFDGGAATVAAQHHLRVFPAHIFRAHDLVGAAMAQHAVLVDARFVGEGVGTDDGLVALHRHADQALQQLRSADDARGVDRAVLLVEGLAHLQDHRDLFQRAVAGALADAIDGAFDLARTAFDGGQRVGHGQAQVVVAMRTEDHVGGIGNVGNAGDDLLEHRADLFRRGEADGVGQVDGGGAGGNGHARNFDQVIQLGAGGILGREFDIVDVRACQ